MSLLSKTIVLVASLASFSKMVGGIPDVRMISVLCGQQPVNPLDPYFSTLHGLTVYVIRDTARNNYNFALHASDGQGNTCYTRGVCSLVLSHQDCAICLRTAENLLVGTCGVPFGAQINLRDCRFVYDTNPV